MRRLTVALSTVAAVVFAASVYAQATNFAGSWVPDADKNPAAMAGGGGGGRGGRGGGGAGPMTVTQDAKTLTITRSMGGTDMKSTYNLDGSDSSNAGRAGGAAQISNATWDGANLKIVTKGMNGAGDSTQVWSMEGGDLLVTATRPGRNGGDPTTTKTYYKKGM